MKKIIRTLAALTLALVLAASLSAAAWADGDTGSAETTTEFNKTATVTINGLMADETVNAYKVVWYAYDFYGYEYNTAFEEYLTTKKSNDALTVDQYFAGLTAPDDVRNLIDDFVNQLPSKLGNLAKTETVLTDSVSFSGLEPGYYIITVQTTANDSNIYLPMSVFARVVGDKLILTGGGSQAEKEDSITLTAKSVKGPNIDKEVWCVGHNGWSTQTEAAVGDVCSFLIPITIPAYNNVATLELVLTDTMTGMEYKNDTAVVYAAKPNLSGGTLPAVIESAINSTTKNTGGNLVIDLDYKSIIGNSTNGTTAYLFYQATVTAAAADSGVATNTAVLTYNRPNTTAQTTASKSVNVYNYAFTLNKLDSDSNSLSGATFKIYADNGNGAASETPMTFTQKDGGYILDANSSVSELPADSSFTLKGLAHGTYYVEEVSTPRGYFLPSGMFKLTLAPFTSVDAGAHPMHEKLSDSACSFTALDDNDKKLVGTESTVHRTYTINLHNATTPVLPTTGGAGTVMFTVGGVAVMVLAAVLFLRRKREE